jgi:transposase InsO family protein
MEDCNEAILKRLQIIKRHLRDHDLKLKLNLFIRALELKNVHEACRRMGFGRTFYYKWWNRFKKSGFKLKSLLENSRRPKHSPRKTSRRIEKRIFDLRQAKFGALMIQGILKRENISISVPTISHILNERKEVTKAQRKKLNPHNKRYELPIPGQRFQMDVKYVPHRIAGMRAFTYVAVDECTRWRFAYAFDHLDHGNTVKFLEMLKSNCPFPIVCIQTDNGFEFTHKLNPMIPKDYIHPMDEWCNSHGIEHRLIPPGVKELNGKVERSHRIDEQYFYWKATDKSLAVFNDQLSNWIHYYNTQRPHGGICFLTPLEKLQERMINLRQELLPKELDWIRNQFFMMAPVKVFDRYGSVKVKLAA